MTQYWRSNAITQTRDSEVCTASGDTYKNVVIPKTAGDDMRACQKIRVAMDNGYSFTFDYSILGEFWQGQNKVALHGAQKCLVCEMKASFSAEEI